MTNSYTNNDMKKLRIQKHALA